MEYIKKYDKERLVDGYRVFKTPTEFVIVQAFNALEAIELSKVEDPRRVERMGTRRRPILNMNELTESAEIQMQEFGAFIAREVKEDPASVDANAEKAEAPASAESNEEAPTAEKAAAAPDDNVDISV